MALFGVLNFAELPLGWKDRTDQIAGYLDATVGLGPEWVLAVTWCVKTTELILGLVALMAVVLRDPRLIMAGMSVMDIWANDRAELKEHTVYFAAFAQLLVVVIAIGLVKPAAALLSHLGGTAQDPSHVQMPKPRGADAG